MDAIAKLRLSIITFQVAYGALFYIAINPSITGTLFFIAVLTAMVMYFLAEFRYGFGGYYLPTEIVAMSADDPELNVWTEALIVAILAVLVSVFMQYYWT